MLLLFTLFTRASLLLLLVFMALQIPPLRALATTQRRAAWRMAQGVFYGLFGVLGTALGVVYDGDAWWLVSGPIIGKVSPSAVIVDLAPIAVAIGGLIGGPWVGVGAGSIASAYGLSIGGAVALPLALANVLSGLFAGGMSHFFGGPRLVAPARALFIGIFLPILEIGAVLIGLGDAPYAVRWADQVGLPLVTVTSTALAAFSAIIVGAQQALWQASALKMRQAIGFVEKALPHLSIDDAEHRAEHIARLLFDELDVSAVLITDRRRVLAVAGETAENRSFRRGAAIDHPAARRALAERRQVVDGRSVYVPIEQGERVIGLVILVFDRPEAVGPLEAAMAQGLGSLMSKQLSAIETERLRTLAREAELKALQAQIHPHFLFNTLNMIHALIRIDPDRARHATVQLGHFLRYVLGRSARQEVTLAEELLFVQAYADIVQARFPGRYAIQVEIEPGIDTGRIVLPPMTVQPLVENSIRHGLAERTENGEVRLSIRRDPACGYRIVVADNGVGFAVDRLQALKGISRRPAERRSASGQQESGIGLANVDARLRHRFGPRARLRIGNRPEGGAEVAFCVPDVAGGPDAAIGKGEKG
ncbi:MAG: histidine kinase [Hydrogenibacillus sp.]|nr:histidine kinase [Hydrogenibacillus sp.]